MKNVIITGGNGMIGNLILKKCLSNPDVKRIVSIARKKTGIVHPKLVEVIHENFLDYSGIREYFNDTQICFYCMGVYTGQVTKEEFYRITVEYTKAFAEELRRNNDQTVFSFLSGAGADSSEKSRIMFAHDKGVAENNILKLKFFRTYIFRPGYIYPVQPRKEPNLMYEILRKVYKPLSFIFPGIGVTSQELAAKMVEVSSSEDEKIIYNNGDIKRKNSK